jgi:hypothetical protein
VTAPADASSATNAESRHSSWSTSFSSASKELLHQSSHVRNVQEFAGPRHTHRLIVLPIEVPGRRVHRDDELGACRQRAFQKTVVGFVPDDAELGEGIADRETLDDFSDEFRWAPRTSAYSSRMAGLTHASMRPVRASSKMSADALFLAGKVASFRMQVSRTTRKIGPGASQRPCASLARPRHAYARRLSQGDRDRGRENLWQIVAVMASLELSGVVGVVRMFR